MRHKNTLIVIAKMPSAGRVKTRLARDIGTAEALRFYRHQLAQTCRVLAQDRRWRLVLSLAPDHVKWGRQLPVEAVIGQGRGGLGTRMQGLFDHVGRGPLIIIGADIPAITPRMIGKAFQQLKSHDFIFGPATDGGFWLVGQRRRPRVYEAFENVRWSTPHALEDVLKNIADCSVAYGNELNDIDTGADYIEVK